MHRFEVWAPAAKSVSVQIDHRATPMEGPDSQGWWRVMVDSAGPGTDYGYLIDDDPRPYPDPGIQMPAAAETGTLRPDGKPLT